jgi:flagellar basal-body rod protein FlgC
MSLFSVLSVSASGMAAQRTRAELLVQNLANSETTRTPEGGAYRRQDAVFQSAPETSPFSAVFQTEMGSGVSGVEVAEVVQDSSPGEKRYMPGHPDADAQGYVTFPNVKPAEDMVDLLSAQRGFQANVAAMAAIKDMITHSIDLMR